MNWLQTYDTVPTSTAYDDSIVQSWDTAMAGRVKLPTTAPWLDELHSELAAFPYGRHDDQVDSLSQFLGWVTTRVSAPSVGVISIPKQDDDYW